MRAAFASMGDEIDQHFGSASHWQIYDLDSGYFIETRKAPASCRGNCEGGFDELFSLLEDCQAVFSLKIGPGAAEYMISHGMRVFEATGPVQDVIQEIMQDFSQDG